MPAKIGSDAKLLLGPANERKWRKTKTPVGIKVETGASLSDDDSDSDSDNGSDSGNGSGEMVFSDTEANSIPTRMVKELNIADWTTGLDCSQYTRVSVPLTQLVLGQTVRTIQHGHGDLRFVFDLNQQNLFVRKEGRSLFSFAEQDITTVMYTAELILIKLRSRLRCDGLDFHIFQMRLSNRNLVKFIKLFGGSMTEKVKFDEMSNIDMASQIRPPNRLNKEMGSLVRGKQQNPRKQLTQSTVITSSSSGIMSRSPSTPSTPSVRNFYQPRDPLLPPRRLRSATKPTEGPITIDEYVPERTKKTKWERKPFKPELLHTFNDQVTFKIRDADFKCLYSKNWINDTLIDFFLKYFSQKAVKDGKIRIDDYHVLSTFFFTKLVSSKNHYKNIQKWVSKINILSKKFIILPINESLHWYGSIIYNLDVLTQEDGGDCIIFSFDSLAQQHDGILDPIRNFIIGYAQDKLSLVIDPERIKLINCAVPKQPNFNDCGVHVIYNVFKFLNEQQRCVELWASSSGKRSELRSLFVAKERDGYRSKLREILLDLQKVMMEKGGYIPDEDALTKSDNDNEKEDEQDGDDDDVVFLDPAEFQKQTQENSHEEDSKKGGNKTPKNIPEIHTGREVSVENGSSEYTTQSQEPDDDISKENAAETKPEGLEVNQSTDGKLSEQEEIKVDREVGNDEEVEQIDVTGSPDRLNLNSWDAEIDSSIDYSVLDHSQTGKKVPTPSDYDDDPMAGPSRNVKESLTSPLRYISDLLKKSSPLNSSRESTVHSDPNGMNSLMDRIRKTKWSLSLSGTEHAGVSVIEDSDPDALPSSMDAMFKSTPGADITSSPLSRPFRQIDGSDPENCSIGVVRKGINATSNDEYGKIGDTEEQSEHPASRLVQKSILRKIEQFDSDSAVEASDPFDPIKSDRDARQNRALMHIEPLTSSEKRISKRSAEGLWLEKKRQRTVDADDNDADEETFSINRS